MNIFGFKIEKIVKVKEVIIFENNVGKVNFIKFEGNGWGFHETIECKAKFETFIEGLEIELPEINAREIRVIMNVFLGEVYIFKMSVE